MTSPPSRAKSRREALSLGAIVDDYIRNYREHAAREMQFYSRQRSLRDSVDRAARCVLPSGKRHSHQRRIPGEALEEARARLLGADLHSCRSFDELHSLVDSLIRDIHMVGELVVYDVSHRIGAHFGLEPERVYLHAGTREGARELGLGRGRAALDLAELPREFGRLSPAEAEDCLCIYKDGLRRASGKSERER